MGRVDPPSFWKGDSTLGNKIVSEEKFPILCTAFKSFHKPRYGCYIYDSSKATPLCSQVNIAAP